MSLNYSQKVTYTEAQTNLNELCNQVTLNCDVVIIEREGCENVALISANELNSMKETLYILSSPQNASNLFAGLDEIKSGNLKPQTLEELLDELENDEDELSNS